tara:strand:+ start:7975 stop:8568 length:594 start_codon:yes stop_codon:yes gene_type:complete
MKSVYNFVVTPIGKRYNNSKKVGDKDLILNTEIFNHQYINRKAKVISKPIIGDTEIEVNDEVIIHHNVFRRWHNAIGEEKNSRSYIDEDHYLVNTDQVYLYKRKETWKTPKGYCFVQPIKPIENIFSTLEEQPLMGIVKYSDGTVNEGELIGFRPGSEFEFVIGKQRLYRVLSNFITIKYEYKGNEEAYNPSWAQSS